MIFEEWVDKYNKKNPQDAFERNKRLNLLFKEDKGFCEIGFDGDMVLIGQLCGDARYWKKHADDVGKKVGIKVGGTINIRSQIMAYIRLFGYKVTEIIDLPDGNKRYLAEHKTTKKWLRASPAYAYEDGKVAYGVTWEL